MTKYPDSISAVKKMSELSGAMRDRMAHIDFTLMFKGSAVRSDLIDRFGIAPAQATKDFKAYRDLAPKNAYYDQNRRAHIRSAEFEPIFEFDTARTLSTLAQGYGDGFAGRQPTSFSCEARRDINEPGLEMVANIVEAIVAGKAISMAYVSLSSGYSLREFVPHTLVDNGLRWHVRGFDRSHRQFRDFVVTRIKDIQLLEGDQRPDENKSEDRQWNRFVDLRLVPHPRVRHKDAIELDYNMQDGSVLVEVRAASAGYLLRLWNVDCSSDHSNQDPGCLLALSNRDALYGVENLAIAPGYHKE